MTGKQARDHGFLSVLIRLPDGRAIYPKWAKAADPETSQVIVLLVLGGSDTTIAAFKRLQPRTPNIEAVLRIAPPAAVEHSRAPMPHDATKWYWDGAHWLTERGGLATGAPATLIVHEQDA